MKEEVIISLAALLVSILTLLYTLWLNNRMNKNNAMFHNLTTIIDVEAKIADVPTVLKFHNLDPVELEKNGLEAAEFAYLLTSFTAGGIYYKTFYPDDDKPFGEGSYRYIMCTSEATIKAWPLLRNFITNTNYKKKIEKTIELATTSKA